MLRKCNAPLLCSPGNNLSQFDIVQPAGAQRAAYRLGRADKAQAWNGIGSCGKLAKSTKPKGGKTEPG
jgi:hypothetical protein